jgi:hypothetical protein
MKQKLFGALVGAILLAAAAPAGATTVPGSGTVNSGGSITAGDPALSFGVTDFTPGAQGISDGDFTNGKRYFDYTFSFSLTGPANVTISADATAGTNILDYHAALFSSSPATADLEVLSNPGPLIDLTDTTDILTAGSTSGNGSTNTLNAMNLSSGNYFLRLFGVIAGNSNINSHLIGLNGTFSAAAVAATPVPPAMTLFATALGLMGFMAWRRRSPAGPTAA